MKELMKLEFRKLVRSKSLYICLAIMLGLVLMSAVLYKVMLSSGMDLGDLVTSLGNINSTFFTLTTLSNADFLLIFSIVIAIMYCHDFEEGTIKNIVAKGYSRTKIFFSKTLGILCATTFAFVICFIFSFALGLIFFGTTEDNLLTMLGLIGVQYLLCISYALVFTFICALFRKKSGVIIFCILIPVVMSLLLRLLDSVIKSDSFKIADYWLDGMITNVSTMSASSSMIITGIVGAIVFGAIFCFLGALINKKVEV